MHICGRRPDGQRQACPKEVLICHNARHNVKDSTLYSNVSEVYVTPELYWPKFKPKLSIYPNYSLLFLSK